VASLDSLAHRHAASAMLARTHGQTATPTTVGKEFANVAAPLRTQRDGLLRVGILGKMNGAVGNFNAHVAACRRSIGRRSASLRRSLGLTCNPYTTQIEPHDWIAEYCHALMRTNTVLIDFARDLWSYISWLFQAAPGGRRVGSSTMPHKINPIDFENAEGNLGLANALLGISRQASDVADAARPHGLDGDAQSRRGHRPFRAELRLPFPGLKKLELDPRASPRSGPGLEVLGEAVQTVMRSNGIADAYDRLKAFTRGAPSTARRCVNSSRPWICRRRKKSA